MSAHASQVSPGGVEESTRCQVLFREINENIATLVGRWSETGYSLFVCECSRPGCAESLELTNDEFETVRADGAHFLVVPGHQLGGVERVVGGNGRFLVVERLGRS